AHLRRRTDGPSAAHGGFRCVSAAAALGQRGGLSLLVDARNVSDARGLSGVGKSERRAPGCAPAWAGAAAADILFRSGEAAGVDGGCRWGRCARPRVFPEALQTA